MRRSISSPRNVIRYHFQGNALKGAKKRRLTMKKCNAEITVGMDVSDKKINVCMLDSRGEVVGSGEVGNSLDELRRRFSVFKDRARVLVAMEAGTHSPWISAGLSDMGFKVLVGNSRKLRSVWASERKCDERDAEMIARIARFDSKLFYPIRHLGKESQAMLAVLKARDALVKSRTLMVNSVRGMLKSMGIAVPSCSAQGFAKQIMESMPPEYLFSLKGTLEIISQITAQIVEYDRKVEALCKEKYPETERLRAINGVGPITSLTFVLTIEDPGRFQKSRYVGPFLGLVPRREQSGDTDKELGISKTGNAFMRRLLVQAAQYILGPFGKDCELRRAGLKIAAKGGKAAKKKAVVAVARKLAVLMHRIWLEQSDYDPFFTSNSKKDSLKKTA